MKKLFFSIVIYFSLFNFLYSANVLIDRTRPRGDLDNQNDYRTISVSFKEEMIPLGFIETEAKNYFSFYIDDVEQVVNGEYKWTSQRLLTFKTSTKFPKNSKITVILKKGIKSLVSGNVLEEDYSWNFNTLRPILEKSSPYNGKQNIERYEKIVLYYNMPIFLKDIKEKIFLLDNDRKVNYNVRYATTNDIRSWEVSNYDLTSILIITPQNPFSTDSDIDIIINSGLVATEGTLGTKSIITLSFETHKYFEFTSDFAQDINADYSPYAAQLNFTTYVKYSDLMRNIEIEPKVQMPSDEDLENDDYRQSAYNSLYGIRFEPETTYTIKINPKLKDIYGQVLGEEKIITLNVGSYNPWLSMPEGLGIIESYGGRKLPLRAINPEDIIVKSRRITENEIIPYMFLTGSSYINKSERNVQNYLNKYSYLNLYTETNDFMPNVESNRYSIVPLLLDDYLGKAKFGLLSLELESIVGYSRSSYDANSYLQVTDMGLTGKFAGDSNTIFVTDLKTGLPLENVNIEIRNDFNKILARAKTDKNGIATTKGFRLLNIERSNRWDTPRQWVIAKHGDDISFIHSGWGTGINPWRFNVDYNYGEESDLYKASMFTERGIYKPGETVHIKGVIRENKFSSWIAPTSIGSVVYAIENSRGIEIATGTSSVNNFGSYLIDIDLPKDSPTGYYNIRAKYDDEEYSVYQSFRVEVFKPLEFESRIWASDKNTFLGDSLPIRMSGWYLFGEPMNEKALSYKIYLRENAFIPPNNEGFRFTKLSWFEDEYYNNYYSSLAQGEVSLDKNGEFFYSPKIDASRDIHSGYVEIEATVEGEDSQKVSASKSVLVYGSDFYFGVKREGYFLKTGENTKIEIIATDIDGNRLKNKKANVKLVRRHWESVKRAITGGRFEWESKQIDTVVTNATITTDDKPVVFDFTPTDAGLYFVMVEGLDSKKRNVRADEYMYVLGDEYVAWAMFDDDLLELIAEKDEYAPGEVAKIMIKSPYDEATALVTIERDYVIDSFVTNIKGSAAMIEVPIKSDYLPNVYIGVSLIKGRVEDESYTNNALDEGKPSFKIGYSPITVSSKEKELKVEISKSHDIREPGDELSVELKVTDLEGNAHNSEVMFSVVDLGVLNLIGYKTPNWFNTFYAKMPLSVITADSRLHLIGQRNYGEKGESPGGDGVMAASMMSVDGDVFNIRKNFLSTAFYDGRVFTDSNGYAKITFNLPDNITSFRIMASAIDKTGFFGASDDVIIVKKNLILSPTIPNFAIIEDAFNAGAIVYNYSDYDLIVDVKIMSSNIYIENDTQSVKILKGSHQDIRFNFSATNIGEAKITILANGKYIDENNVIDEEIFYKDAIEKIIQIDKPLVREEFASYLSMTNDSNSISLHVPDKDDIYENTGSIDVFMSASILGEVNGGLDYLINYPYFCLEQQLSRIYPILTSKRLIIDMKLTEYSEEFFDNMIKEVLKNMSSYQNYSGGFAYFTSKTWVSSWLTVYTIDAMNKAKKAGFEIDEDVLQKALEYVNENALTDFSGKTFYNNEYINLSTLAYASSVLSEAKMINTKIIDKLYDQVENIPFYGQVYLMTSMYYAGYDEKKMETVRDYILNSLREDGNKAFYELDENDSSLSWIHSSSVRDTAVALSGLIETGYDNPINEKVVRWLLEAKKNGRYLNTQDNVAVFNALNKYFEKYESDFPDMKAEISYNNQILLSSIFNNRKDKSGVETFNYEDLGIKYGENESLLINREGSGRLYYGIKNRYALKNPAPFRDNGISVLRYITDKNGKTIENNLFRQGEEYIVVVKINVDFERQFVVVDAPIAAGFKILNTSFATESSDTRYLEDNNYNYSFSHIENYENKVLLFSDLLSRGEHTYKYVVRATTPGEYLLPATKSQEMYNDDVYGYDGADKITIEAK